MMWKWECCLVEWDAAACMVQQARRERKESVRRSVNSVTSKRDGRFRKAIGKKAWVY